MGWVSTFLSKAVIAGLVLGFSIGIVIDQSHKLLGVPAPSGSYFQAVWGTLRELPAGLFSIGLPTSIRTKS